MLRQKKWYWLRQWLWLVLSLIFGLVLGVFLLPARGGYLWLYLKSQVNLAVIIGLMQTGVTVFLWKTIGAYYTRTRLYQLDTNRNFRRVDSDQKRQDRQIVAVQERQSYLEGKVEVLERINFSNKNE